MKSPWYRWLRVSVLGLVCLDDGEMLLISCGQRSGKMNALRQMVWEWRPDSTAGGW